MKTTRLLGIFFILSIVFFFVAAMARAEEGDSSVNVNISNSTGGNNVDIKNDVTTSVNTSSNTTTNTHVRVEQNGKVTEFNTDDVDYTSEDGTVKVKVDNDSTENTDVNDIPSPTPTEVDEEEVQGAKTDSAHTETEVKVSTTGDSEEEYENSIFVTMVLSSSPFNAPLGLLSLVTTVVSSLS